jgi:hypothetical protein
MRQGGKVTRHENDGVAMKMRKARKMNGYDVMKG